jgi:hypothetical protein
MVQEETVVESETRIVECKRLALVWGSGDHNLSDAHVFKVGTYTRPRTPSKYIMGSCKSKTRRHLPLICSLRRSNKPC